MTKYLAIIPARKGSKGIKNKNIQLIGRKPMVKFTLEAAKKSKYLSQIVISTNDPKVEKIVRNTRIGQLIKRPNDLARDNSPTSLAVRYTLDQIKQSTGAYPENIVLLQITSPFRTSIDIDNAIHDFEKYQCDRLVAVCEVSQHPSECGSINHKQQISVLELNSSKKITGRQQYTPYYFISGAIYICKTNVFLKTGEFMGKDTRVTVLPKSHSLDIDNHYDLAMARAMYNFSINNKVIFQY